MRFGYARISTDKQDMARQIDALENAQVEKIFMDTITGGKEGGELRKLISQIRTGDEIVVCELSRLGRNMSNLIATMNEITEAGASVHSIKEGFLNTDDTMSKLFFYLLGIYSEMERDYIRERTLRGLEAARARGRTGGRPKAPSKQTQKAVELYKEGRLNVEEILKVTGISRATLYRYLKK